MEGLILAVLELIPCKLALGIRQYDGFSDLPFAVFSTFSDEPRL